MLLGLGGVISAQTLTKDVTKPIILKGGKSSSTFTTDCYIIEMQGWQNFIVYEDAEGVGFDENSTMVFDVAKAVSNGNVRVTLSFSDNTSRECWWCLGIGDTPDDTSLRYYHDFDGSTVYIKKLLGDDYNTKKDLKITKVTVNNFNGNDGALIVYEIKGGTICGKNMTIKQGGAKSIGCYSGTFSATAASTNIFQYKPLATEDFQKIIIKFDEAVSTTGGWKLNDNGGIHSLSGKTEYEITLDGSAISDFTIFNWDENPAPIKIKEVYFYKKVAMNSPANTTLLSSATVTGFNSETKLVGEGKWTFETPIDVTPWLYLVITTAQSTGNTSAQVRVIDNNGITATGDDNTHDSFKAMYFDYWNNQNVLCVDLYHLAENKGLDLTAIKSITIQGTWGGNANIYLSQMYLTNHLSANTLSDRYHAGELVREYSETGKYGTICLPYVASYAGCEVYSIASLESDGIALAPVSGLLEAGKPYFYISTDNVGKNYSKNNDTGEESRDHRNVNFFRADLAAYDKEEAGTNNGLIGTFSEKTAPAGENYWILSSNKLYDTEGCTGADAVTIGANKAYIDKTMITNQTNSRTILLSFDGAEEKDPTAIESTEAVEVLTDGVFYDMSGREVKNPTPGIYIVKYGNVTKKVMIK